MKTKDIPMLKEKILGILPITQAEIWKNLGIKRRDVSSLINVMVDDGLVKKTKVGGTFLVESLNGGNRRKKHKIDKKKGLSLLLSKSKKFSPCTGCAIDCDPPRCYALDKWIKDI